MTEYTKADESAIIKRSLQAVKKLQAELAAVKDSQREPIAVIGMACRFPGNANSPKAYWQMLRAGMDAIVELPSNRQERELLSHDMTRMNGNGTRPTPTAGFLEDVDRFDAMFFGISPREAITMDPQQRLLLEVCWEALESASIIPDTLVNSKTGIFIGMMQYDYAQLLQSYARATPSKLDLQATNGVIASVASGRIAYTFGFIGPAITTDTACSSSLIAIHQACQSLRSGVSSMAIAGGVNLILTHGWVDWLSYAEGPYAPDNHCKTFDAAADGFSRGEGCGLVVLKRLSDAQADGDNILGVIRGSMTNQDGRSSGLSAPSGTSQQRLLQQALSQSGLTPEAIGYIEAHGTGTQLGDPIEMGAINEVFRERTDPLWVGSVKTNFGHLEGAAGISGFIKVILGLQHGQIPPHLNFHTPNPLIDWDESPVQIPTSLTDWPKEKRIAGVSSFGISGTNAHVIVEEAPPKASDSETADNQIDRDWHLLTLSAKTEEALVALAQKYSQFLEAGKENPELALGDICYTAHIGRSHFAHRLSIPTNSTMHLQTMLVDYTNERANNNIAQGYSPTYQSPPSIAFLFTGQGTQYVGMGRVLYEAEPTFRATIDHGDELYQQITGESLLEVIYPTNPQSANLQPADLLHQTTYTQPALFVLEYALAKLWQSWGIQPEILLGHSVGEIVAACVAGVFGLEDGLKLIAARGRLMGALPQDGEMVSLLADETRVQEAIEDYATVSIAAINGPESVVISGRRESVLAIADTFAAEGVKTRKLMVSHAFHSPLMDPMLDEFRQVAESIIYHQPTIQLVSNVTGKLSGDEITTPDYWVRHVREAVRFADGIDTLHEQGIDIFLEIGPKPTLLGMAGEIPTTDHRLPTTSRVPSLRENQNDWQQMLTTLGELYVRGVKIDWHGFDQPYQRRKIVLPTYPFQRQPYWLQLDDVSSDNGMTNGAASYNGFAQWLGINDIEKLTDLISEKEQLDANERQTVTKVLTALEAESHVQQLTTKVDSMLYEVAWHSQNKPTVVAKGYLSPETRSQWLVLSDDTNIGHAFVNCLIDLNQAVDVVKTEVELVEYLKQLPLRTKDALPLQGVVHLWGMDQVNEYTVPNINTIMQRQERILGSVLKVVQALTMLDGTSPRLFIATQGAQKVTAKDEIAFTQTSLWGVGRVIALEHPELWGGLVDLDSKSAPSESAENLLAEILQPPLNSVLNNEAQIAYRSGKRLLARLMRSKVKTTDVPAKIHADSTYLITGGLGAVGLIIADWLADEGAKHLILTGRSGVTTAAQQEVIDGLETEGVKVEIALIDVTNEEAMRALFMKIAASAHPLRGIFHMAGILDDGILLNQTWKRFASVMSSKVKGAWLLHQLTQEMNMTGLENLVFFSSAASLLGNLGQGSYAAANAFMDGLARYRQQQGLPGISINWGAWAGYKGIDSMIGRTASVILDEGEWITPEAGMMALAHLMTRSGQMAVAPIDWTKPSLAMHGASSFLNHLVPSDLSTASLSIDSNADGRSSLIQSLKALAVSRRRHYLQDHLQKAVSRTLGMTTMPERMTGFADLGMDSLMALELRRLLERELRQPLPTTIAFEYPTVDSMADYLLDEVLELAEPQGEKTAIQIEHVTIGLDEPIAVISMACRFPGAESPEAFWQLLQEGKDMVQEVPTTRWNVDDYYDSHQPTPGKMYMREAAFIDEVDQFDPLFFGISPREAMNMDPQHRLLLEVSWEALERAHIAPSRLVDSQTGVFIGIGEGDSSVMWPDDLDALDSLIGTGSGHSIAAGRLAYTLGLQGPTMAVDTACSSSLVALHLACQSLRTGECDLALSGGASLMLSPIGHIVLSQMQALSPNGRCKTFDSAADGYGRGEGGGMVLLKRLSDAEADGDAIFAVIKGSAVNHDGPSSGLTVPNKRAQEKLLHQALKAANITPNEVAYVEAHGTGTPLGDPIEIRALGSVFSSNGSSSKRDNPLLVGSVKTNVGHLEAAAGIAGFIKTVLAIHHRQIPPHLHFNTPNPYIEWDEFAIDVSTRLQPWPTEEPVAGVSSFGLSGTNSHVIVAAAPQVTSDDTTSDEPAVDEPAVDEETVIKTKRPLHLLPLSAKSEAALSDLATRYLDHIRHYSDLDLGDLCYTAAVGRNHFNHRLAIRATNCKDIEEQLAAIQMGTQPAGVARSIIEAQASRVAFLFTGQGSQYVGMGRELYEAEPTFRSTIDYGGALYQQITGESLLEVIYPTNSQPANLQPADRLHHTTYTQPALFVLEYALAKLWQSWGIQPDILLGHSVGEIVAACVAGVFSLEDGLKLIAARGRLMGALPQDGEMVSLLADEARVQEAIEGYGNDISIAAINGPESVVISGKRDSVLAIADTFAAEGVKTRKLAVSHAFHSPLMDPMLDEFRQVAESITYHQPTIQLVSNVTGKLSGDEITTPNYWVRHVREAVRFADGVATLREQEIDIFLEVGPKPTLLGMAGEIPTTDHRPPTTSRVSSLRENQNDWQQMLLTLGELYVRGVEIDWQGVDKPYQRRKVVLPTYPFQRQPYWLPKLAKKKQGIGSLRPLIDKKTHIPHQKQLIFEKAFSTDTLPFLADHHVYDQVVVPGACHLSLALSGADLLFHGTPCEVQDVIFPQALAFFDAEECIVQLVTESKEQQTTNNVHSFQIISFKENANGDAIEGEPTLHATGRIISTESTPPAMALGELQKRCDVAIDVGALYQIGHSQVTLGPTFRWLSAAWRSERGEALARMQMPDAIPSVQGYLLYPSLIDACFQLVGATMLNSLDDEELAVTKLPFAVDSLTMVRQTNHEDLWCYVAKTDDTENAKWDIVLFTTTGEVIAQMTGYQVRSVPREAIYGDRLRTDWLYAIDWLPLPLEPSLLALPSSDLSSSNLALPESLSALQPGCWLILGAASGIGAELATLLATDETINGSSIILALPGTELSLPDFGQVERANTATGQIMQQAVIDPTAPWMFKQLLTEISKRHQSISISYLWGIDDTIVANDIAQRTLHIYVGLLHLVQAVIETDLQVYLSVVTQGCQSVDEDVDEHIDEDRQIDKVEKIAQLDEAQVASGVLWGLGRTIALEHPRLHCTCIDFAESDAYGERHVLLQQEMMAGLLSSHLDGQTRRQTDTQTENQILYQRDVRHVARLAKWQSARVQSTSKEDATGKLSSSGSYLITGGLGALGLEAAEQLAAWGARHLILSGRRDTLSDETKTRIQAWERDGSEVHVIQADISQRADVQRLLTVCNEIAPLSGIVHAAGVIKDGLIQQQSIAQIEQVMAAKVEGTWLLHTLTLDTDLAFFVCFSSAASMLGSAGQSNYAAANAFMDTLMAQRRRLGLSGLSINWGAWAEVGMAADLDPMHYSRHEQGITPISPAQACQLLGYLVSQSSGNAGVLDINWPRFLEQGGLDSPLFSSFASRLAANQETGLPSSAAGDLYEQLLPLSEQQQQEKLRQAIREEVARTLGISSPRKISVQQPLFEFGIDSLMALELKNRLEHRLSSTLHSTLIFDYPTISGLATYLFSHVFGQTDGQESSDPQGTPESADGLSEQITHIIEISDDEAEALLLEKLQNL
ncbi:MAG: SDR family NAD(P)-dependent oxidoreductase [Chloroflexota bacterium]